MSFLSKKDKNQEKGSAVYKSSVPEDDSDKNKQKQHLLPIKDTNLDESPTNDFSTQSFLGTLRSEFDEEEELSPGFKAFEEIFLKALAAYKKCFITKQELAERLENLTCLDKTGTEWTLGATSKTWYKRADKNNAWLNTPPPTRLVGEPIIGTWKTSYTYPSVVLEDEDTSNGKLSSKANESHTNGSVDSLDFLLAEQNKNEVTTKEEFDYSTDLLKAMEEVMPSVTVEEEELPKTPPVARGNTLDYSVGPIPRDTEEIFNDEALQELLNWVESPANPVEKSNIADSAKSKEAEETVSEETFDDASTKKNVKEDSKTKSNKEDAEIIDYLQGFDYPEELFKTEE